MKIIVEKNRLRLKGVTDSLQEKLREELSYFKKNFFMEPRYQSGDWDGRTGFIRAAKKSYLTEAGFLRRVVKVVARFPKKFRKLKIIDDRKKIKYNKKGLRKARKLVEERPFQQEVLENFIRVGYGLVHVGVGGGKTHVMSGLCMTYPKAKILILVPTIKLLHKTIRVIYEHSGERAGQIGDGKWEDDTRIIVATYRSLFPIRQKKGGKLIWKKEARKIARTVDLLMVDECHHAIANNHKAFLREVRTHSRIGFSGTINLKNETLLCEGLFGPVLASYSLSWLIKMGYCAEARIAWIKYPTKKVKTGSYREDYDHSIVYNENRNTVFNWFIKKLVRRDHLILGLVRYLDHGEHLEEYFNEEGTEAHFIHGKMKSSYIDEMADKLNDGEIPFLISTPIFDEGVDIPYVTTLLLAVGEQKEERLEQRLGRVLRAIGPKTHALIIDGYDGGSATTAKHSRNRLKFYKKMGFEIREYNFKKKNKVSFPPKIKTIS